MTIRDLTIEEMKKIVGGAPEGATHTSVHSYFKENDYGVWSIWSGYWNSAFRFPEGEMYLIKDLRTAIADYEMVDSYGGMTMAKRQLNLFLRVNNERGTEPSIRVTNLKHAIERIENNKGGAA